MRSSKFGRNGAIAVLALLPAAGCQAIVGIEPSPLAGPDGGLDATSPNPPDALPVQPPSPTRDAEAADGDAADAAISDANDASCPPLSDAAPDADAATCVEGARRCTDGAPEQCSGGAWVSEPACAAFCRAGVCETPPSCSGTVGTCATGESARSCCAAHRVPGGSFKRSWDPVSNGLDDHFVATVSDFLLDDFEVTVERFARFVSAWPASKPAAGAGKNPHDPNDPGWVASWPLPADRAALEASLACDTGATWGAISRKPVNCVSWYLAQAFCIWDGGRLPTEAEWNYAAAGGGDASGQRVYPWSSPSASQTITAADAVFSPDAIALVGSRLPKGAGRWGHADLAGNVAEWVVDAYAAPYAITPCIDCADHSAATDRAFRGGSTIDEPSSLSTSLRSSSPPDLAFNFVGFRCAR